MVILPPFVAIIRSLVSSHSYPLSASNVFLISEINLNRWTHHATDRRTHTRHLVMWGRG